MKKTQKQILGCFGLGLVATMTVVAATMPSPYASAVTSGTITDTLEVRVVGETPAIVNIEGIAQDGTVRTPAHTLTTTYENLDKIVFTLTYKPATGETKVYELEEYSAYWYPTGTHDVSFDLSEAQYNINDSNGYGSYTFTATGTGPQGVTDTKSLQFDYAPFSSDVEQNEETGKTIDITIDDIDGNEVSKVEIYVNGELKDTMTEDGVFHFTPSDPNVSDYEIVIVAYDKDGNIVYRRTTVLKFDWMRVPDTGRFFTGLNIANEDYLITGLIVFFVLGIVGFGVVARNRKMNVKSSKRR